MHDDSSYGSGYKKADRLFNLITSMQMKRNERNSINGIHRLADMMYCMSGNEHPAGYVSAEDIAFFKRENHDYTSANNLLHFVSFDDIEDLRKQFVQFDKSNNAVSDYTSSSSEFMFMNILQYHYEPDNPALDWVIAGKLKRGLSLLRINSPDYPGKKGLIADTASIFDTLTGNGTDGTNPFYIKTRERLPFRILNALVSFSENAYAICSENGTESSKNILPARYNIRDMIVIGKRHDPYATTQQQEKIIPSVINLGKHIEASENYKIFSSDLKLIAARLTENIEANKYNPLSSMQFIPN